MQTLHGTPSIQAVQNTLSEREKTYGAFKDNAATAQHLKSVMRSHMNWYRLQPFEQEALEMIMHKISRILNANPDQKPRYTDSWHDIAGYATLAEGEGKQLR